MTEELFLDITRWQRKTFPTSTALSKLHHLKQEVDELINAKNDLELRPELADCFILLLGAADACGLDYEAICDAVADKMEINKNRTWGSPDANGVVNHISEQ